MRNDIVDILLEIGIPAGVKGFTYIYDALELFDTDTYYSNGKICSLYADIAKKRGTTASSVEEPYGMPLKPPQPKEIVKS